MIEMRECQLYKGQSLDETAAKQVTLGKPFCTNLFWHLNFLLKLFLRTFWQLVFNLLWIGYFPCQTLGKDSVFTEPSWKSYLRDTLFFHVGNVGERFQVCLVWHSRGVHCALQLLSWEPVDRVVMKMAINELYSWKNLEVEVSVLSGVQDVCSCSVENGHQWKKNS